MGKLELLCVLFIHTWGTKGISCQMWAKQYTFGLGEWDLELKGFFISLLIFLTRHKLIGCPDLWQDGPLSPLFFLYIELLFCNQCLYKKTEPLPLLAIRALKNLVQFHQYSFFTVFPPSYFITISPYMFFNLSSKPRCLNIGCSGS